MGEWMDLLRGRLQPAKMAADFEELEIAADAAMGIRPEERAALTAQAATIPVGHALAAAWLDRCGFAPDDLRSGLTVLTVPTAGRKIVREFLVKSLKSSSKYDAKNGTVGPGLLFVLEDSDESSIVVEAIRQGAAVVVVSASPLTDGWSVVDAAADRHESVRCDITPPVLADVIAAVTGDVVKVLMTDTEDLPLDLLLLSVRRGDTGEEALGRLRTVLMRRFVGQIDDGSEPESLGKVAASTVTRLRDLTGFGAAKDWGLQLAADLADYRAGRLDWIDISKGVLLAGPPGCGKTYFASALAEECDCELIVSTYDSWQASGSGDTMSKGLRKLFSDWRKKASRENPIIVFVDEIDSIGARGGNGNNESWFGSIVNTWLAFLDGAEPREGIVVIAATNFPDRVDAALRRPGRLDITVDIPLPTVAELPALVHHHAGDVDDIQIAAKSLRGRTPAQVAFACRQARRIARRERRRVSGQDIAGIVRTWAESRSEADDRVACVHESGHAVSAWAFGHLGHIDADEGAVRVIVPKLPTRRVLLDHVVTMLAGRAAEEILLGEPSVGAVSDLQEATSVALRIESSYGFGANGLIALPSDSISAWDNKKAVRATLDACYSRALALVRLNMWRVEKLASRVAVDRYLDASEVEVLMRGDVVAFFARAAEPDEPSLEESAMPWRGTRPRLRQRAV